MTITNTSSATAPVNRILSTMFLKAAEPVCVYFKGSDPGDVIESRRGSFTILWRQWDNLTPTTTALTEITGAESYPLRNGTELSVSDVTATVSKYGQHAILSEELTLREQNGTTREIARVFGVSGGRSLNRLQRNVMEDNATLVYADGGSADNEVVSPINYVLIEQVCNTLLKNFAETFLPMSNGSTVVGSSPILPSFYGFCHTDVAQDITKLAGFKSVETYASHTAVMPNEFGMIDCAGVGVRFMQTPEASADTGSGGTSSVVRNTTGSADLYTTLIVGQRAVGALSLDVDLVRETYKAGDRIPGLMLIEKAFGSAGTADPLNEAMSIGWKGWHGGKVFDSDNSTSNYIRGIRTAASLIQ